MLPESVTADSKRLHFVDGLRALALLVMVSTHGFKAWIEPSLWTGTPLMLRTIVTRIPGAVFFFLVGISYVLARNGKVAKGLSSEMVLVSFIKRGLQLLLFAYLYKAIDVIFGVNWIYIKIWLVDVLNIISVSLVAIALLDYLLRRIGAASYVWFVAAFLAIIAEPFMFSANFPSWMPYPLRWYLQGVPPDAHFTVFPFAGLALFGVQVGEVLSKREFNKPFIGLHRIAIYPVAAVLMCSILEFSGVFDSGKILRISYFMKGFFLLLAALYLSYLFQKKIGFGPLLILGSHTMIGYWFHAKWEFIYYKEHLNRLGWNEAAWLLAKTYAVTVVVVLAYAFIKKKISKKSKTILKTG